MPLSHCPPGGVLHRALWVTLGLTVSVAAGAQAVAPAGGSPAPAAAPVILFDIRGFDVVGENPLSASETTEVLAPFLRTKASIDTLGKASEALEAALKSRGFGLHRVTLPPQELGATVRLEVVSFKLAKVDYQGMKTLDRANIERGLPVLRSGSSPNLAALATETKMSNAGNHKQVRVGLKASEAPDAIDATVTVQESSPWQLGLDLSNSGTAATGHDRFTLLASHSNVFDRDHQFSGVWTSSFEKPGDVKQWGLTYKLPLYLQTSWLTASFSRSDVVGRFGAFSSTGAGDSFSLALVKVIPLAEGQSFEWNATLADRLFRGAQLLDASGAAIAGTATPDTRGRSLSGGFSGTQSGDNRLFSYGVNFVTSLSGGRGNDLASFTNGGLNTAIKSRSWKAIRGNLGFSQGFPSGWVLSLRSEFQMSPDALIAGEQFGVGGASSLRGLKDRALQGDQGVMASLQLNTPPVAPGLQLQGFLDSAQLRHHNPNASRLVSDRASTVGVGLRWAKEPNVFVSVDYGRVITGSRLPAASFPDAPKKGDDRMHVTVSLRY